MTMMSSAAQEIDDRQLSRRIFFRHPEGDRYLPRGCFRGPFRGQLRGPFRGHRFRILTGMRCTTTWTAEDGYFRASETSEKSLAAEVFAEDTAEDEGAHSPAWQRVRANVERATSR